METGPLLPRRDQTHRPIVQHAFYRQPKDFTFCRYPWSSANILFTLPYQTLSYAAPQDGPIDPISINIIKKRHIAGSLRD